MSDVKYKLDEEFRSLKAGTRLVRIAVFGDGFIHDEKLQVVAPRSNKKICVNKEDLDEFFTRLN